MDISMDIHEKSVDMNMDIDGKFHTCTAARQACRPMYFMHACVNCSLICANALYQVYIKIFL